MSEIRKISKEEVANIPFFYGLSDYDLSIIAEYLQHVEFKALEYVFKEGEHYGSAFFLIKGAVQILKQMEKNMKPKVLAEIRVPQMFGELALISKGTRSASVLALETLTVAELSCDNFEKLILHHPELGVNIIRRIANVISNRLKISNTNYVNMCNEMESSL